MNGGLCELDVNHSNDANHLNKVCHCIDDYIGPYCDDLCLITCQNGGVCIRKTADDHGGGETDSSDFECECPLPYDGPLCSTIIEKEDRTSENDETSAPVMTPSTTQTGGSVPSAIQTDPMSSPSASSSKILGMVFGVGIAAAVTILLYAIYSKRKVKHVDGTTGQKNAVDTITTSSVWNDPSQSHGVTDIIVTDDESVSTKIVTTTTTNSATLAMTDDGPQFVPDTTYSHTVKLNDVA
jgi:hypothetical protein